MSHAKLTLNSRDSQHHCSHELATVDMSGKGNLKSLCDLTCETTGHPTWTNCRVHGSCTLGGDADAKP